jgi:hypothetical protein
MMRLQLTSSRKWSPAPLAAPTVYGSTGIEDAMLEAPIRSVELPVKGVDRA